MQNLLAYMKIKAVEGVANMKGDADGVFIPDGPSFTLSRI